MEDSIPKGILRRWEQTGRISKQDLGNLEALKQTDPAAYQRVKALLPFMRRDAGLGGAQAHATAREPLDADFTARTMRRIAAKHPVDVRVRPAPSYRWIYLAASLGVFIGLASLLVHLSGGQSASEESYDIAVRFELIAPTAKSVAIVGDFNDWQASDHKMRRDRDGVWYIVIRLAKAATYSYNFLIDGEQWVPDPQAQFSIDDPFGGRKSVLSL